MPGFQVDTRPPVAFAYYDVANGQVRFADANTLGGVDSPSLRPLSDSGKGWRNAILRGAGGSPHP